MNEMSSGIVFERSRSESDGRPEESIRTQRRSRTGSIFASVRSLFMRRDSDSPSADDHDSPQEDGRVFRLSEQDAWMLANHTAASLVYLFITGCILLAVFYVLEPFLYPLLWAVLVGMVLHPFKHASTSEIHNWLGYLDDCGVPLSVGLVLSPFFTFNHLALGFENTFFSNWKLIVGLVVAMATMVLGYLLNMPLYFVRLVRGSSIAMETIHSLVQLTGWLQLCSLVVGFVLLLVLSLHYSSHRTAIQALSVSLWFLALLNIGVSLIGTLAVPLVCLLFISAVGVSLFHVLNSAGPGEVAPIKQPESNIEEGILEQGLSVENLQKLSAQDIECEITGTEDESCDLPDQQFSVDVPDSDNQKQVSFNPIAHISHIRPRGTTPPKTTTQSDRSKKIYPGNNRTMSPDSRTKRNADSELAREQSNQVFLVLFTACLVVVMWHHPVLLVVPAPLAFWCALKHFISLAVIQNSVLTHITSQGARLKSLLASQQMLLFPWPLPAMYDLYLLCDRKVLQAARRTVGALASALIIVLLLVGVLAVTVLLVFQIQVELTHYASTAVSVWNYTLNTNPQIQEWLGAGNESVQTGLESFANTSYTFAREKMADWLHTLVADSAVDTQVMEQRILGMIDKLYSVYVVQNTTLFPSVPTVVTPTYFNSDSLLSTFTELLPFINTDTMVTVLSSVWAIVSDNLAVGISFLYSLLELLFSGGTLLLNTIVFLTALFYLLSYSEADYLPVRWVMDLLPHLSPGKEDHVISGGVADDSENYGKAFSRAIRSVFHATLRRAFFYGLYTWLTHTLFGLSVSILPAVLACLAGAIPFIGAYWVALPAVLELWLQDHLLSALALTSLSLLPLFFVDNLINREIEGGHPYLTGLAVAGGIYFSGLEGALIGPILLSCLLFVVDLYDTRLF